MIKTSEIWETLPFEVQFDIEMTLYKEFNNEMAKVADNIPDIYSERDMRDLKLAKATRKKELVIKYLKGEYVVDREAVRKYLEKREHVSG